MAATEATIGKLSVIIGGDAKALDKMLAGAASSVNGFAAKVGQIAGGVGLVKAVEAVTGALVNTVKQGLDSATAVSKLTDASGAAVEEVSKLSYAMTIATGSNDGLGRSLQSLSTGIADVAAGKVTDASNAIGAMGLNIRNTDGSLKTSTQLLGDVAAKFATYKDGASKAALAQALFGAGGESMIPLLNKGREGIAELGAEADRFGLVLDGPTRAAVQSINTNLAKLDAAKNGLAVTIAGKLAPAFAQITGAMVNFRTNSSFVEQAAGVMAGAMKYVATVGLTVVTVFGRVTSSIGDLFTAARLLGKGDFNGAWATITGSAGKSVDAAKDLKDTITDLWSGVQKDAPKAAEAVQKVNAPLLQVADSAKNALELYLDGSAKRVAAMQAEAATIGSTADVQARARVEEEANAIAKAKNIKLTDDYRMRIAAAGDAAALAALKLQGANVTQESLTAWELRNQKLAQYTTLLANAAISQETFNRLAAKTQFPNFDAASRSALDLAANIDQLATNSLNGLSSALANIITGSQSAGEAFAQFSIRVVTELAAMIIKALLFKAIMLAIGFSGGGPVGMGQSMSSTGLSLTSTGGLFDSGGFTGVGGKYEPAGIVHKGEVVFSQDDVAAWGGVANVEALRHRRLALPGFADGGAVSAPRVSVPQVPPPAPAAAAPIVPITWRGGITDKASLIDLIKNINAMHPFGYRLKFA
jgi:lambda family phage tail tape measure protein